MVDPIDPWVSTRKRSLRNGQEFFNSRAGNPHAWLGVPNLGSARCRQSESEIRPFNSLIETVFEALQAKFDAFTSDERPCVRVIAVAARGAFERDAGRAFVGLLRGGLGVALTAIPCPAAPFLASRCPVGTEPRFSAPNLLCRRPSRRS